MLYEIKLADGDRITYESDMTLEELKSYIASNDFIEIPRSGTVPYGRNGWRSVPELGSYKTSSIVYVNHDVALERCREHNNKVIEQTKPIVDEIFKYEFNRRMKWYFAWNIGIPESEEDLYFCTKEFLYKILAKCKKYKCKVKEI